MFRPKLAFMTLDEGISVRADRHKLFGGGTSFRTIKNLTPAQLIDWLQGNEMIQDTLSHLTPEDREFLLTGLNPGESL